MGRKDKRKIHERNNMGQGLSENEKGFRKLKTKILRQEERYVNTVTETTEVLPNTFKNEIYITLRARINKLYNCSV
jgi:hypothetical protein